MSKLSLVTRADQNRMDPLISQTTRLQPYFSTTCTANVIFNVYRGEVSLHDGAHAADASLIGPRHRKLQRQDIGKITDKLDSQQIWFKGCCHPVSLR